MFYALRNRWEYQGTFRSEEAVRDKIEKILAPTDLSELSEAGVRYALNLARVFGAEVTVYHAVNHDELMQYSEGGLTTNYAFRSPDKLLESYHLALARFLRGHFSDLLPLVETREKVVFGRPDKSIVEEAKKEGSDWIVMSTHGRKGLSHLIVGSVTEKVVRHAPCPVLSIHPQPEEKATQKAAAAG